MTLKTIRYIPPKDASYDETLLLLKDQDLYVFWVGLYDGFMNEIELKDDKIEKGEVIVIDIFEKKSGQFQWKETFPKSEAFATDQQKSAAINFINEALHKGKEIKTEQLLTHSHLKIRNIVRKFLQEDNDEFFS